MRTQKTMDNHPLSINILKFQRYNFSFLNCQEIVLLETLLVLGGISFASKNEFFHSTQTLSKKTGIKKHSVDKIIIRFKELGFIEYCIKGMPKVKYIKIKWENIIEQLPQFYQFNENHELYDDPIKLFVEYFQPLINNAKEKNINKNIREEYKKENNVIALGKFRHFLIEYFGGKKTVRSRFNEDDFYEALEDYSYDQIVDAIPNSLKNNLSGERDMRMFFNRDSQGKIPSIEIRINERKAEKEIILKKFNQIMKSSIERYNENNAPDFKKFTSLPIYESSFEKIKKVFKKFPEEDVYSSFTAFCDDVLNGHKNIKKDILGYFLTESKGNFDVVNDYIIKYIISYSSKKFLKDCGCIYFENCSCS